MMKTVNLNPTGPESFLKDVKGDDKIPSTSRYAWPTDSGRSSSNRSYPSRSSRSKTNSFFIRNSPHPSRVKHIKGLLDAPICTVLDAGADDSSRPGTRFSIATPSDTKRKNADGILKLSFANKLKEKPVPHIGLGEVYDLIAISRVVYRALKAKHILEFRIFEKYIVIPVYKLIWKKQFLLSFDICYTILGGFEESVSWNFPINYISFESTRHAR